MSINSSNVSAHSPFYHCVDSVSASKVSATYNIIKSVVLLPLCVLVFLHGLHRFSHRGTFKSGSHSDVFTYHLVALELSGLVGVPVFLTGIFQRKPLVAYIGFHLIEIVLPGELCFHILTCVDRYLAVVHPVTYRRLKQSSGVWIRNVSIGCAWLLTFVWKGVTLLYSPEIPATPLILILLLSFTVVCFCSLNVLCVLIHPRPGNVTVHTRKRSCQRALVTVMAIMVALLVWFTGLITCISLDASELLNYDDGCLVMISGICTGLPSSLVLPLLFLHRARKTDLWSAFRQR